MDKKFSEKFFDFLIKCRYLLLFLTLVITIFFVIQLKYLRINGSYDFITDDLSPSEYVLTPINKPIDDSLLPKYVRFAESQKPYLETAKKLKELHTPVIVDEIKDNGEKNPNGYYYDGFAIVITSEDLFSPTMLSLITEMMEKMDNYSITGTCLSPFSFVTFEKKGSRIALTPMNPHSGYGEWTEEEAILFKERLINDDVASNYLYNRESNTIMLYYLNEYASNEQLIEMRSFLEPLRNAGATVAVTGLSTISERLMHYLSRDLFVLLILCFIVILISYFCFFRSLRGILIPASMSILGIIWTLGWMAMMGYELTLVTLLTPCLVLIVGSSYSIHMLSEYFTVSANDSSNKLVVTSRACSKIFKTIILAGITTFIGFFSLSFAKTTAYKQFGFSIAIGVFFCVILSLTYLPSILSIIRKPKQKRLEKHNNGIFTTFINRIGKLSIKYWKISLVVLIIFIILFMFAQRNVKYDSNYMSYFPRNDEIIMENVYFAQTMGGTDPFYLTIRAPNNEKGYFLRPDVLKQVFEYEETVLSACPDIMQSLSFTQYIAFINRIYSGERSIPDSQGMINTMNRYVAMLKNQMGDVLDMIINDDATEITLSMRNFDYVEQDLQTTGSSKRIGQVLDYYRYLLPEGTTSRISCFAYDLSRGNDVVMNDQMITTLISFFAVFIISIFTFKSLRLGFGVMIPVAFGIMANYIFMWIFGISFDLVTVGFSSIAIGIGIDDALHFSMRFRNRRNSNPNENISNAILYVIQTTGKPIIETTISIIAGMLMLLFGSYAPIKYFGTVMCVTLFSTNIATLFILPAYLTLIEKINK
ncbi:MAG: efflux RND transporter permease subunit [Spirochaetales bacterium]|nr:efflux RND transporter permease subunit [Spirochaetales bacterium]